MKLLCKYVISLVSFAMNARAADVLQFFSRLARLLCQISKFIEQKGKKALAILYHNFTFSASFVNNLTIKCLVAQQKSAETAKVERS